MARNFYVVMTIFSCIFTRDDVVARAVKGRANGPVDEVGEEDEAR